MDRGLWITWYNLADDRRGDYLSWLHSTYLPELAARRGVLWVAHYASLEETSIPRRKTGKKFNTTDPSVPNGDRYILIAGAEDTNVFGDPSPSEYHAKLPAESQKMLALRQGQRTNVMTEAARVLGPACAAYSDGMALAPCIQLGSFQSAWQEEEGVLAWYAQWRMPSLRKLEGLVRARKLASVAGWAKQAILYEFVSPQARDHFLHAHEDGNENREWTDQVIAKLMHAPGSANVGVRTWPLPPRAH